MNQMVAINVKSGHDIVLHTDIILLDQDGIGEHESSASPSSEICIDGLLLRLS